MGRVEPPAVVVDDPDGAAPGNRGPVSLRRLGGPPGVRRAVRVDGHLADAAVAARHVADRAGDRARPAPATQAPPLGDLAADPAEPRVPQHITRPAPARDEDV